MTRTDMHLDAMLRHLGAAYYESQYGRASRADVARALGTVEEHLSEQEKRRPVGMPVLTMGRHVAGVVSEADLLAIEDEDARRARMNAERPGRLHWPARHPRRWGLIAGELMTTPAITIHPDATIPGAARVMNARHVRRLPVVDPDGVLLGIISRRDLLSVFLRPDADIAADARELLDEILRGAPAAISAAVHEGVVVLTGAPEMTGDQDPIPLAIRLIWHIDGVVDVINRLGEHQPGVTPAEPAPATRPEPSDKPTASRTR